MPVPPLVEVTLPVVLFSIPAAVPVTVMFETHVPPPAMLAPDKVITFEATANVPPHCEVEEFAAVSPAGNESVKPTPVSVAAFKFATVIVSVEVPPISIGEVSNDLLIDGGPVNSSAPMSGVDVLRVSASKSVVIPEIGVPALPADDALPSPRCKSTVEDVPLGIRYSGFELSECES